MLRTNWPLGHLKDIYQVPGMYVVKEPNPTDPTRTWYTSIYRSQTANMCTTKEQKCHTNLTPAYGIPYEVHDLQYTVDLRVADDQNRGSICLDVNIYSYTHVQQ